MRVCYIAYSCSPYGGSEEAIGWNLPVAMASYADVTVITKEEQRAAIDNFQLHGELPDSIHFEFCDISPFYKKIYRGGFYSGRLNPWLEVASERARKLHGECPFDILHQITPIEFRALGSYELPGCRTIAGPLGGGEYAPSGLGQYLDHEKVLESVRRVVNEITLRSPGWKRRFRAFDNVLFANVETMSYLSSFDVLPRNCEVLTEIGIPRSVYEVTCAYDGLGKRCAHNPIRLLFMGRLVPRKGVELLFDACCELKRKGVAFQLRICGEGKQAAYLRDACLKRGLESAVMFMGPVPHDTIGEEYEWCDAVVMPSLRETGGAVVAEALSHLKPVVSFDAFGAKLILGKAPFCKLAETRGDCVSSFAEAIMKTIELSSETEAAAYFPYLDELSWDNKASYYANLYCSLLRNCKGVN